MTLTADLGNGSIVKSVINGFNSAKSKMGEWKSEMQDNTYKQEFNGRNRNNDSILGKDEQTIFKGKNMSKIDPDGKGVNESEFVTYKQNLANDTNFYNA